VSEFLRPLTDPGIESLSEILGPEALAKHLQGVCLGPRIGGTIHKIQVRLLRHHIGRRCTLEIGLCTERGWHFVIGKVYHNDRFEVFQSMEKIQRVGFGPQDEFSIPQPLAYLHSLRLHLLERVEGPTAEEVFSTGDEAGRTAAAERCALWLARFHALAPHVGPVSNPNEYFNSKKMRRCKDEIAKLDRRFAGKPDRLLHLLEEAAPSRSDVNVCAGHGAYRLDHILLTQGRTVVIDIDTQDVADPARDLARFLVALRRLALELGSIRMLDTAAEVFRTTYLAVGSLGAERNLPFFEAAACLKRAMRILSRREVQWRDKAEAMLDEGLRAIEQEAAL
jgi:aminoglycoside phosphotransferase (APT) family kinase protein